MVFLVLVDILSCCQLSKVSSFGILTDNYSWKSSSLNDDRVSADDVHDGSVCSKTMESRCQTKVATPAIKADNFSQRHQLQSQHQVAVLVVKDRDAAAPNHGDLQISGSKVGGSVDLIDATVLCKGKLELICSTFVSERCPCHGLRVSSSHLYLYGSVVFLIPYGSTAIDISRRCCFGLKAGLGL